MTTAYKPDRDDIEVAGLKDRCWSDYSGQVGEWREL